MTADDDLAGAWNELALVLPDGWRVIIQPYGDDFGNGQPVAIAENTIDLPDGEQTGRIGSGVSVAAAIRDLAAALR